MNDATRHLRRLVAARDLAGRAGLGVDAGGWPGVGGDA
jgi:hypothetical protein